VISVAAWIFFANINSGGLLTLTNSSNSVGVCIDKNNQPRFEVAKKCIANQESEWFMLNNIGLALLFNAYGIDAKSIADAKKIKKRLIKQKKGTTSGTDDYDVNTIDNTKNIPPPKWECKESDRIRAINDRADENRVQIFKRQCPRDYNGILRYVQ